MAAPTKRGLDYFPCDTDLLGDIKLRKPKMKHGYLAPMVYISLLSLLYRDKGYYIDYRDKDNVIWQVLIDLQGKHQPTQETVAEVIDDLVACGLFSGDLYRAGIITSLRSQTTYYKATVDRKTVDILSKYWLIDLEQMKELSAKHCYYLKCLNSPINEVNQPINGVNQPINKQSKVKESKVNKSKVNYDAASGGNNNDNLALSDIFEVYARAVGRSMTTIERDSFSDLAKNYGIEATYTATVKALERGKTAIAYIRKILENQANTDNGRKSRKSYRSDQTGDIFGNDIMEVD